MRLLRRRATAEKNASLVGDQPRADLPSRAAQSAVWWLLVKRHDNRTRIHPCLGSRRSPGVQVASLEDNEAVKDARSDTVKGVGSGKTGLGSGTGSDVSVDGDGGGAVPGWVRSEQVLGQRLERVATAWLEAIDQVCRTKAIERVTAFAWSLRLHLFCCALYSKNHQNLSRVHEV